MIRRCACGCVALVVVLVAAPGRALGHGTSIFVSTPATPPVEQVWVLPLFLALTVGTHVCIGAKWFRARRKRAYLWRSALWVTVFSSVFFLIGAAAVRVSSAPPPGLGLPHQAFYGLKWRNISGLFLTWNAIGLVAFSGCALVVAFVFRGNRLHRGALLWAANMLIYVLCLVPFFASGAFTHGILRGRPSCHRRMLDLCAGTARYSEANGGRMPPAKTAEQLVMAIRAYHDVSGGLLTPPPYVCPQGGMRDRDPKPYIWNSSLTSAHFANYHVYRLPGSTPVITCPYHGDSIDVEWLRSIYRYVDEAGNAP